MQKQFDCGITIGNDGEQPRVGFQTYMPMRMDGFGGATVRGLPKDMDRFPKAAELVFAAVGNS